MLIRQTATLPAPPVPAYRPFRVAVSRVLPLSPHLVRVTFTGPDLGLIAATGLDHRIKLVLPLDGRLCDVGADDAQTLADGSWYARWRELPDEERCPIRTYTIRHARPERGEVDVDMVLHEPRPGDGPAVRWLRTARTGDEILLVGPDRRAPVAGVDWRPGGARHLLLVGDETAAPAICAIIEGLPDGVAQGFVEVPTADDILTVYPARGSRVSWLARDGGCATAEGWRATAPHGRLLQQAVTTWLGRHTAWLGATRPTELDDVDVDTDLLWDSPPDPTTGDFYAWVAGEAAMVRDLRRLLVQEVGVPRSNAAFLGYWRDGRPEPQ
ncbi:MAG TPA: siderophore-interacting protein [Actinotalea sp.]|mgnify:CR=1 FL=1|nr:siderophore-interacting protein [Actinotalea sp.]